MQTLAGLALDTEHQRLPGKDTPDAPSRSIQHLLNTFVLLNIFHFLALIALAHLDRRRKAVIASVASLHGSPVEISSVDFHQNRSDSRKNAGYSDDVAQGSILSPPSARAGLFSSVTSSEQTPLLSDERRSYFADSIEPDRSFQIHPPKTKEIRRGELFTGLSAMLVVFAWVLFLVTAWLKLRSKAERGRTAVGVLGH